MNIPILLSTELIRTLALHGIKPEDYRPAYGGESAGLDLFNAGPDIVVPPVSSLHVDLLQSNWLDLSPEETKLFKVLVPTGLRMALPLGTVALVRERGSVSKTPLTYRAGVIDPGYTGEVWVAVLNHSPVPYVIKAGDKLPFQIVVTNAYIGYQPLVSIIRFEAHVADAKRQSAQLGSSDTRAP
jgi:dUTPase